MIVAEREPMVNIKGLFIFRADSGITLYSKRSLEINEDLLSAFMSAIREFFASLSLGGLSTFSTDYYVFYYTSINNVATVLVLDESDKSDLYYSLCFEICSQFYSNFKSFINSDALHIPNVEQFADTIADLLEAFDKKEQIQQELIQLYKINKSNELESFSFINENQLFNMNLFVAVNIINKRIYVVENEANNVPGRLLYLANKEVINMNQREFKSEFDIKNLSDEWDFDRIIGVINNVLGGVAIKI